MVMERETALGGTALHSCFKGCRKCVGGFFELSSPILMKSITTKIIEMLGNRDNECCDVSGADVDHCFSDW